MRHFFVLGLFAGMAGAAAASFDLVMVMDQGTNSIHRFDGSTGAYLGDFARGFLTGPRSFSIDRSLNRAYVADNSGIVRMFNYNTGVHEGDLNSTMGFAQSLFAKPGGNLISGFVFGQISELSATTGSYLGFHNVNGIASGASLGTTIHTTSGNLVVWTANFSGSESAIQVTGPAIGSTQHLTSAISSNMGGYTTTTQIAMSGDLGMVVSATGQSIQFSLNTAGTAVASYSQYSLTSSLTGPKGVAFGHGRTMYMAGQNASNIAQGRISRGIWGTSSFTGTFGEGILINPGQMAVIAAPEPGSLIALGLGAVALLRRRRAR